MSATRIQHQISHDEAAMSLTVFNSEQRRVSTSCLFGKVVMYVIALTPWTGKTSRAVALVFNAGSI